MRKATLASLAILLAVSVMACTPGASVKSGAAAGEALIKMLPKTATGVVALDIRRLMATDAVTKALQEPKNKAKLDEFIKMSGIDPAKDITYAGAGLIGVPTGSADGGAIISLTYDQAKLKALIKEKAPQAQEELYEGVTIYSKIDGDEAKQTTRAAFLDAGHIILGSEKGVKSIIDVSKKKAESLAKSAEMAPLLKRVDKSGIFWAAFAVPPELLQKGIQANAQLKALEGVTGLLLGFDDKTTGVTADIKAVGGTKEQNTNLAQVLNGFKAMGAMAAGQEPVVGEALNGIAITSGADYTDISLNISHELMDKIGQMVRAKAGQFMKPKKEAPPEEKK